MIWYLPITPLSRGQCKVIYKPFPSLDSSVDQHRLTYLHVQYIHICNVQVCTSMYNTIGSREVHRPILVYTTKKKIAKIDHFSAMVPINSHTGQNDLLKIIILEGPFNMIITYYDFGIFISIPIEQLSSQKVAHPVLVN